MKQFRLRAIEVCCGGSAVAYEVTMTVLLIFERQNGSVMYSARFIFITQSVLINKNSACNQ